MASKTITLHQMKQLQYKSQIIQSFVKRLETSLKAYNASKQFSGSEQFLSITKLKLKEIEDKILTDRLKEQQLQLANNVLTSEIDTLHKERNSLYQRLKSQENKLKSSTNVEHTTTSKVGRRNDKTQKSDSNERTLVETGLHVIKGAIVNVMDIPTARTTMSVHFSDKPFCGSITVGNCDKLYKIDQNIKQQIEDKANEIIQQNVECVVHKDLDRKVAEDKFGDEMYDFYPVPQDVQVLSVLEIKNWNINCSNKPLCKTTGELIALKVGKSKFNAKKKQLTVYFTVGADAK